jgi:hypothetical protein
MLLPLVWPSLQMFVQMLVVMFMLMIVAVFRITMGGCQ